MTVFRVEVALRPDLRDPRAEGLVRRAAGLGLDGLRHARLIDLYFLQGDLQPAEVERIGLELLADPVTQIVSWRSLAEVPRSDFQPGEWVVEVGLRPGVMDPVADQLLHAAHLLGVIDLRQTATGQRYILFGELSEIDVDRLARRLLCNEVIHRYHLGVLSPAFPELVEASALVEEIAVHKADDAALLAISRERRLALNLEEMAAIRQAFQRAGRPATDVELETLAQTWSEHCVHKTFKARIDYSGLEGSAEVDGLLRSYIRAATERLAKPWVRSAFVDNAGIVDFDDEYEVSFKVETHNHPSALEPFGGANTGVGGVVRDILGVSHRPIATTDVLCFGPADADFASLPPGTLHPRRVADGVIAGVQDYGNKLGLPTVSGAILFHPGYTANPLVFCGCMGMAPKGRHRRVAQPGDRVVVLGGGTGRDGLRGATFSSASLTHETGEIAGSAVQIGDPITEKGVLEVVLAARDAGLYHAVTDCGAGGLSSAVGEMGAETGVDVELGRVRLKYPGLRPWEIWLSEAQERMVLAVPPANLPALEALCREFEVTMSDIGRFTDRNRLIVHCRDQVVVDLDMEFLHCGLPRRRLTAIFAPRSLVDGLPAAPKSLPPYSELLLTLLASPNIASKERVIRLYDHEVQAGTLIKPMVGAQADGPSDAAVLKPLGTSGTTGLALACGINPSYGNLDAYAMAVSAVDEAIRNCIAVGADPQRIALLDNFCWGNPDLPDRLGDLVRACQGCYDAAIAYGTPFISGKDSLNNEYIGPDGQSISIPPTLLISALGIVPDIRRAVTMDLKTPGNRLYLLGETKDEMGGSAFYAHLGLPSGIPPGLPEHGPAILHHLHQAIQAGWVRSCHDCSEGGLAVALAEMCIAGRLGANIELRGPDSEAIVRLFSESNGRFVVEVRPEDGEAFMELMRGLPIGEIGYVQGESRLHIAWSRTEGINLSIEQLRTAWQGESMTRRRQGGFKLQVT